MERSTICINTSDRSTPLFVLINSLLIQTCVNFDIVVVDDGVGRAMTDVDLVYFRERFGGIGVRIKYVRNQSRQGLSASRNIGIDNMSTKIGIFLDDDHICDSRFVEFLMGVFEKRDNVGCVGALFPHIEGSIRYESCPPRVFGSLLDDSKWGDHQRLYYPFMSNADGIYPAIALGGIVAFRIDDRIRKDSRLSFVSHTEDTLFSLRYIQCGYNNYVNIRSLAYHRMIGDGGCRTFPDADAQRARDAEVFKSEFEKMRPSIEGLKL